MKSTNTIINQVPSKYALPTSEPVKNELVQAIRSIQEKEVDWSAISNEITLADTDVFFLSKFSESSKEDQRSLFIDKIDQTVPLFFKFLTEIKNAAIVEYVLCVFDSLLEDNRDNVKLLQETCRKCDINYIDTFLLVSRRDWTIQAHLSIRCLSHIISSQAVKLNVIQSTIYLKLIADYFKMEDQNYSRELIEATQRIFLVVEMRDLFLKVGGIPHMLNFLKKANNFQLHYQLLFSFWLLSFSKKVSDSLLDDGLVFIIGHILQNAEREKVYRMSMAILVNMIKNCANRKLLFSSMIGSKMQMILKGLNQKNFNDEELLMDVDFISVQLNKGIEELTNLDEYVAELSSGQLDWTITHRSERFWRENISAFCENNYEILKMLINILNTSTDPTALSVACNDSGEFVRHYPIGKSTFENLGGKTALMNLIQHEDNSVRHEALIATQKFLVNQWEYLSAKLNNLSSIQESRLNDKTAI